MSTVRLAKKPNYFVEVETFEDGTSIVRFFKVENETQENIIEPITCRSQAMVLKTVALILVAEEVTEHGAYEAVETNWQAA